MCVRQATKQKVRLSERFWENNSWKVTYKQHILAANQLLKIFEPQAIINALNQKECNWITSLRVKALTQCIMRESEKLEQERIRLEKIYQKEAEQKIETPESKEESVIVKPFSHNKSRLKDLD